jgi:hypothetical protein
MKRLVIPLVLTALLVSCGGSTPVAECTQDYWNGTVGTCLPEGWTVMDRETMLQRGLPEETVVAFSSDASVSGQFPSITVTQEPLAQAVEAVDYSAANIRAVSVLPGYKLIDSVDLAVDGVDVALHTFAAQPLEEEPARRFYQISTVQQGVGYTITAAVPLSVPKDLEAQVLLILKSVTFVGAAEG